MIATRALGSSRARLARGMAALPGSRESELRGPGDAEGASDVALFTYGVIVAILSVIEKR